MMHCPDCHCVVLEENEFRCMIYYLEHNVETSEDADFIDVCKSIIKDWEEGDKD